MHPRCSNSGHRKGGYMYAASQPWAYADPMAFKPKRGLIGFHRGALGGFSTPYIRSYTAWFHQAYSGPMAFKPKRGLTVSADSTHAFAPRSHDNPPEGAKAGESGRQKRHDPESPPARSHHGVVWDPDAYLRDRGGKR